MAPCGAWTLGVGAACRGGVGAPPFAGAGLVAGQARPVRRCRRVLGGLAWCHLVLRGGGGESPSSSIDPTRRGAAAAAVGGTGRLTVVGGVGPGGPLGRGLGGGGDTVRGTGGLPLVVGGVWKWSARLLPSHTLVLLVHGGLWPGGIEWWAVVVVGLVLVVVVVRLLVVVALVVVGMVLRVWP